MTVSSAGLEVKTLAIIRAELRAAIATSPEFGPQAQTGAYTVLGQLLDVFAASLADAWAELQALYDARRADAAPGSHLDDICALVGVVREPQTHSTVGVTFACEGTGTIPAGTLVRVPSGPVFATDEATAFSAPPGSSVNRTVQCTAVEPGALSALAGTVTEIVTAVSGVTSASNLAAAAPGQERETDTQLRMRREQSLSARGAASEDAIMGRVLALTTVDAAGMRSNRTASDAPGLPAHSARLVVWPSTAPRADVLALLADIWPAGIYAVGVERDGSVAFDYATALDLQLDLTLATDVDFPTDGVALVEAAVTEYVAGLTLGETVYPLKVQAAAASIPGVVGCTVLLRFAGAAWGVVPLVVPWDSLAVLDVLAVA